MSPTSTFPVKRLGKGLEGLGIFLGPQSPTVETVPRGGQSPRARLQLASLGSSPCCLSSALRPPAAFLGLFPPGTQSHAPQMAPEAPQLTLSSGQGVAGGKDGQGRWPRSCGTWGGGRASGNCLSQQAPCESTRTDRCQRQRPESLGARMPRSLGKIRKTGKNKKKQGRKQPRAQKGEATGRRPDGPTEGSGGRGTVRDVRACNHCLWMLRLIWVSRPGLAWRLNVPHSCSFLQ